MTIKIAAIGFGRHFRRSLLPNLIGTERFALTGVAELDEDLRNQARARFPGSNVTADADELLNDPQTIAVIISAHPDAHVELTQRALKAGKHVFVEKPLGTQASPVRELAMLAGTAQLVVMTGTMWRFAPAHQVARAWMAEHDVAPRLVDLAVTFPPAYDRPGWDLDILELAFFDMFIHPIDWASQLLGGIGEVDAVRVPEARPGAVAVNLRLTNRAGTAMASVNAVTGSDAYQVSAWIHTDSGPLIEIDTKDRLRITALPAWSGTEGSLRDRATLNWETGQLHRGWARKGYAEELHAFADRIEATAADASDLWDAASTLDIIRTSLDQIKTR